MNRTLKHILLYMLCMLFIFACPPCHVLATIVDQTDAISFSYPIDQTQNNKRHGHSSESNSFQVIATSQETLNTNNHNFMHQVTDSMESTGFDQILIDNFLTEHSFSVQSSIWLITKKPAIRGNKNTWLPMDSQWLLCYGERSALNAIEDNYQMLVNDATQHQKRRTASLVAIAKTGTALPLSFEVSRRVRGKSVPEPTSITFMGLASLLLLRRKKRCRQN